MTRLKSVAAIELPVEEARGTLDRLHIVKGRECLDGRQRQSLDEVISDFEFAIEAATEGVVQLTAETCRAALCCFWDSQNWMKPA